MRPDIVCTGSDQDGKVVLYRIKGFYSEKGIAYEFEARLKIHVKENARERPVVKFRYWKNTAPEKWLEREIDLDIEKFLLKELENGKLLKL